MENKFAWAARCALVLIAAVALAAVARGQEQQNDPPPAAPARSMAAVRSPSVSAAPARVGPDYVIGPGDLLAIDVWNEPEITGKVSVRTDGRITLPLVGEVQASGLTPSALQAMLSQRLQQYVKEPAVTVAVEQMNSHRFNVLGEVEHPGSFPLAQETHVLDALAQAGGFRDFAKVTRIYVLHHTPDGRTVKLPFNYKRVTHAQADEENIVLQAGDSVIVP
ncbi:MAG TPA: polysaccharide biosynthesis/export family protein [Terriglobales bacterium]|jgi:polysaccharide export outer membrane protein|nr:polysaccharide biosynthesis/export family protein [Terriglobales bacterium]